MKLPVMKFVKLNLKAIENFLVLLVDFASNEHSLLRKRNQKENLRKKKSSWNQIESQDFT